MADKRAYFKMDVGYFMNPKVVGVASQSPMAILLHLGSIAYATQHLTDGDVPKALILRLSGASDTDAELLLNSALWEDRGNGIIEPHDYLEHQRSAAEVKGAVDKATKASRARWGGSDAPSNAPSNAPSISQAMPDALLNAMPREREREKEQNTLSLAAATDDFEAFWEVYPRKDAKGKARIAYRAAAKKVSPARILASLKAQLPGRTFEKPARGAIDYRPLPASWLNAERWADEVAPAEPERTEGWWNNQ